MSMAQKNQIIDTIRDQGNAIQSAHQTQEDNWRGFLQQTENLLRDTQQALQDSLQKQQDFCSKLDQELQTLEQDMGKKTGLLALLSPSNILAKQEQVSQKRVALLQGLKQNQQNFTQLAQQITAVMDHVATGCQQLQEHGGPVRTNLQQLQTELGNLDQEFNSLKAQLQTMAANLSQDQPAAVKAPLPSINGISVEVLAKLGQAEAALLNLKQVLEKGRMLQQVTDSINEFGHAYSLHQ